MAFAGGSLAAVAKDERRAATSASRAAKRPLDGILTHDADGYRYVYQVITGREALYELRSDPLQLHNIASRHAELTRRMRCALESRMRVTNLDSLRSRYAESIRTLESLGYL